MKKLYYAVPFIVVPISILLCELLDNTGVLKMSPYVFGVVIVLLSAVLANLTPTHKKFDYYLTAIMPLALVIFLFAVGFLDATETRDGFDLNRAFKVATQPVALLMYCIMAVTTFVASYKGFRFLRRSKIQ